jgi:hypothetical protein
LQPFLLIVVGLWGRLLRIGGLILDPFVLDAILVDEYFLDVFDLVRALPDEIGQFALSDVVQIVEVEVVDGDVLLLLAERLQQILFLYWIVAGRINRCKISRILLLDSLCLVFALCLILFSDVQ